jgi:nitrite reductase/ring-hydroxylating ferredoxin subunit|tara:strand:- start:13484 stop:14785 length:1302 start_codon:yes stop_codon:yes gene_type:complete
MNNKIKAGEYKVLKNYYKKKNFLQITEKSILDSISIIAGQSISNLVYKSGLNKIHLHFDPDYLPFLQNLLSKKIDIILRKQIYDVSTNDLNYHKFFIDAKTNYRLIYPYSYGKKSTLTKFQYLMLNLNNYDSPDKEIKYAKKKVSDNYQKIEKKQKNSYFKNLPVACYGHGPHRDTWFGHTFNACNFWWSITGVNKKSGLLIFPEAKNHNLAHLKKPAYVKENQYLGESKVISLNDGDLLLFDPEILHATRINTSNDTRIVYSGRINNNKPVFYEYTKAIEYKDWFYSEDFKSNNFVKKHIFLRKDNLFKKKEKNKLEPFKNFEKIIIKKKFLLSNTYKIINKNKLKKNKLYSLNFTNTTLGMKIINKDIKIFQGNCPHLSISLLDGHIKKNEITCPGHGLIFNLKSGKSDCKKMNLKIYETNIKNNLVILNT